MLFSPKSLGHFYEMANFGAGFTGFGVTKQSTVLFFSPKLLGHFYETANFGGLERVLGAPTQVVRSFLRDGKFRGGFLFFSPKSLGHFYETANLGGLERVLGAPNK